MIGTGDGKLDIEEFLVNLEMLFKHILTEEELLQAFRLFDRNNNGYIS